ncbi:hypothetical protein ACQKQA_04270 [Pseudomonas sp. NPDC089530]|uniref:hypothetical protein n=1 Tax=Pseudomonas sp. NPDC089530 TaxID=3390651 RepID=UPI003D073620
MKVTILSAAQSDTERSFVEFSTFVGNGLAHWRARPTAKGQTHDVEVEIDDDFFWGKNIKSSAKASSSIENCQGTIHVTAKLISSEDDGLAVVELDNSIVMLSTNKKVDPPPEYVDFTATHISLYPTNL